MIKKSILFLLILVMSLFLFADKIADKIKNADNQYKKGYYEKAVNSLSEAIMMIKNKGSLKITKTILCTSIKGYGDYTKIDGYSLKIKQPLLLYIEVEGFKVLKENEKYLFSLSQDVKITDESGKILFQKKDWVTYKKSFPVPLFPFHITNRITDIPQGKYKYEITINDHYRKTFTTKSFNFEVK